MKYIRLSLVITMKSNLSEIMVLRTVSAKKLPSVPKGEREREGEEKDRENGRKKKGKAGVR